jgi:hypothetical protein
LAKHKKTVIPQPPYLPDLAPADILFIPQIENVVERPTFWVDWLNKEKFASGPVQYPEWSILEMFQRMEEMLRAMYSNCVWGGDAHPRTHTQKSCWKPKGRQIGRPKQTWKDNTEITPKKTIWKYDWIQ